VELSGFESARPFIERSSCDVQRKPIMSSVPSGKLNLVLEGSEGSATNFGVNVHLIHTANDNKG
jgi:hypothetical protein